MRMRRPVAALLGALALLAACSREPDLPPPAPALWEVTGPDGAHGWLFGTAHALPDLYDWRTDTLDRAFAQADVLAVEVDLDHVDPAYFEEIATTAQLGPPSARLDPADRAKLAAAFAQAGLAEGDFDDTESWAVALVLANAFSFGEGENGVDRALIGEAGAKRLVELEGYAGQLAIFDGLAGQDQLDMLAIVAEQAAAARAEGERQARAWRAGDLAALEAEMKSGLLADPELREALLVARNRAWAAKVETLLIGGETVFVAAGAAHMVGEEGLPGLLEARGYTVTRIQ